MKSIVECLDAEDDRVKAVACHDIGEFARFHPHGRKFISSLEVDVKEKMAELMKDPAVSAEVKKEAITCF